MGDKYTRLSIRTRNFNYKITGYSQLFKVFNYNNQDFEFEGNTFSLNGFNNGLTLYFNQKSIDLSPEIDKIINQYKNRENEIMVDEISFTKKVGNYELKFLLDGIEYNKYEGDRGSYFINQDIIVLIKKL